MFCKKGVLRNFAKFAGKHLGQSLFFKKNVAGLSCFPVNFLKPFLRTFFFIEYIYFWVFRFCSPFADRKLRTGCSTKRADHCSFLALINHFEKVLLINFMSAYASWVKHFILPHLLLIECYEKSALCNQPLIVTFIERFKIAILTKPYWYTSLPLTATFIEQFKKATSRKSYWNW